MGMRIMQFLSSVVQITLFLGCSYCQGYGPAGSSSASRVLANSRPMFVCGEPGGPCGKAIPKGIVSSAGTCSVPNGVGPGYCQEGYYCGYDKDRQGGPKCVPLPKDCGKAGKPCCPSNAETPHKSMEDALNRKPFCKDGSYCFFAARPGGVTIEDEYVGNVGDYNCAPVSKDCGTGPGSPCCPLPYKTRTNPELPRFGCPGKDEYCNYEGERGDNAYSTGTCLRNAPDCGKFGKSCCVFTASSSSNTRCGDAGRKGYCANPPGFKGPDRSAKFNELVCTPCPDKIDAAAEDKQPGLFFCK